MRVSALEGHRIWASSYNPDNNPLLALERRSMESLLHSIKATSAIDVGCGTGRWLLRLQEAGVNVHGVDFCEEMLVKATRHSFLKGLLALGDAEHLPFRTEAVDLVLCSMALGYFEDLKKVFREFSRVAIPGAYIAISDLHPATISAGWTRSFRAGATLYEIDHHGHSLDEIDNAARGAGLLNMCRQSAYLGLPEFAIFEVNGKADLFLEVSQTAALYLQTWKKPC